MNTATLLFSLTALTAACVSQQPAPAKAPFVLEAGEIALPSLIDRCAAYLGANILVAPDEMVGPAAQPIRLQQAITTDQVGCEELLAEMLYRSGFALTHSNDKGTMLEVISMNGPRARIVANRSVSLSMEDVLARPNLKRWVTTTVPLQHVNAVIATNALRPFFASTGAPTGAGSLTLGNVGNNSSMLLSGMQDQVAQAVRLLRTVDVPPSKEEQATIFSQAARIDQLEQRVKALEEKLAGAGSSSKPK